LGTFRVDSLSVLQNYPHVVVVVGVFRTPYFVTDETLLRPIATVGLVVVDSDCR
jgi:hypothetical protein